MLVDEEGEGEGGGAVAAAVAAASVATSVGSNVNVARYKNGVPCVCGHHNFGVDRGMDGIVMSRSMSLLLVNVMFVDDSPTTTVEFVPVVI